MEPEFAESLENVTVALGRDAVFSCSVSHLNGHSVCSSAHDNNNNTRPPLSLFSVYLIKTRSHALILSLCVCDTKR